MSCYGELSWHIELQGDCGTKEVSPNADVWASRHNKGSFFFHWVRPTDIDCFARTDWGEARYDVLNPRAITKMLPLVQTRTEQDKDHKLVKGNLQLQGVLKKKRDYLAGTTPNILRSDLPEWALYLKKMDDNAWRELFDN